MSIEHIPLGYISNTLNQDLQEQQKLNERCNELRNEMSQVNKYSFEFNFNENFMTRIVDYKFQSSEADIQFHIYLMKEIRIYLRKYLIREPDLMEVVLKQFNSGFRMDRIHISYENSEKYIIIDGINSTTLSGIYENLDNWFDNIDNIKKCYDQLIGNKEREREIEII